MPEAIPRLLWCRSMLTLLLAALLAVLLYILVTFLARPGPIRDVRALGPADHQLEPGGAEFRRLLHILSGTSIVPGNQVELLPSGAEVLARLWDDLDRAERLITCQLYWWKPGRVADRTADVLTERVRAGVPVCCLVDWYGAQGVPREYFERLRSAGVEVAFFRPPRWNTLYKLQQRSHVRTVIIDARIGYTGGLGIDDRWNGDGRSPSSWRDTGVRIEGPAVEQMQGAFASNWAEATGDLLLGNEIFRMPARAAGDITAGLIYSSPSFGSTAAERFLHSVLASAQKTLMLGTAYFVPERAVRRALIEAAGRGVEVRVLTPGRNTDRMTTWYAGSAHYGELLEAGVRIYEYRPTMYHSKLIVADGQLGVLGTLNLDNRSLVLNDEVVLLVQDPATCRKLEALFLQDLEYADELKLEEWQARSRSVRVRQRLAGAFSHLL